MVSRTDGCIVVMQESRNIDEHLDTFAKPVIAFVLSLFAMSIGYLAGVPYFNYIPLLALSLYLKVIVCCIRFAIEVWK